jgi:hypothetical protein
LDRYRANFYCFLIKKSKHPNFKQNKQAKDDLHSKTYNPKIKIPVLNQRKLLLLSGGTTSKDRKEFSPAADTKFYIHLGFPQPKI